MDNRNKSIRVLLVDDNPGDVRLMVEVFKESPLVESLLVASDGEEALKLLRGQERDSVVLLPSLIVLDIHMPRLGGLDTLAQIKSDDLLMHIPVVILTTSRNEEDVSAAYLQYASCYIIKPVELDQYVAMVKAIESFWLEMVMMPTRH